MKITLIGSGNVATTFAKLIAKTEHRVIQVMSRSIAHAQELALVHNAGFAAYDGTPDPNTDLFIIASSDQSFERILPLFQVNNKLIVHTAGAISKDILQVVSSNYGVIYPLQSLHKKLEQLPEIPLLVEGNTEENTKIIEAFAKSISGSVKIVQEAERFILNTAAVIVCNFTNYLYGVAEEFCESEKADFDLLKPLILETAHRVMNISPREVQTGPAIRKDIQTLDKHLRLLHKHPKLRTTYMRLTDGIMNP